MTQDIQRIRIAMYGQPCLIRPILCALTTEGIDYVALESDQIHILALWVEAEDDLHVVAQLSKKYPSLLLLGLTTMIPTAELMKKAMAAGVHGYTQINLRENETKLQVAIKRLALERIYIAPHLIGLLLNQQGNLLPLDKLSPTQRNVAICISQKLTNKEIAEKLNMSRETVKKHVSQVLRKCNVSGRAHLWGSNFSY